MKVLKFGGTSVGSASSMQQLKLIVEREAAQQPIIVVVSALGGITDQLIRAARMAVNGDDNWTQEYDAMRARHHKIIYELIDNRYTQEQLLNAINALFDELRSIYYGVYLIRDLSQKTLDAIVSYGEKMSSRIVAAFIEGAKWMNAMSFIKTETHGNKTVLDSELTAKLVEDAFFKQPNISIVPGFISTDKATGETTNLGRGGSDYTASIIAAALNAELLEIWTDVDGFMTADPKVIKSAYTIGELSYIEAMELCNFGAKVIYPPTIYPVCLKNIPIKVRNTFNPDKPGSVIKQHVANDGKPIKGISSIADSAVINVAGLSMVGVIGVNRRIFNALANEGISVFMVAQASSENSTSIGVREEDADKAAQVLDEEFAKEIATGAMFPMHVDKGLATVAIVGENMKHTPGITGKLFGTLGRSGVSVIAFAQGASETNISFMIAREELKKSLNVLHDSFFLSEYKVLNLFICGVGTVGGMLIDQIRSQYDELKNRSKLKLNVVGIASSKRAVYNRDGLDLDHYRDALKASDDSNPQKLKDNIIAMNIFNSVFVDCTASTEIALLYQDLLDHNVNVVTANKIAASADYSSYAMLKKTAVERGIKFRFETNVGAGLPIIGTINDLFNSGDRILKIEAVLSGTLNFIFNALSETVPFSETVRRAQAEGYSEPDPRADLSGTDVVRKLVILTREAGYKIEQKDVERRLFIPEEFFDGPIEDFWKRLPSLDIDFEKRRKALENQGKRWRFVATMENGKARVSLDAVGKDHPFWHLEGSNNIVLLTTERYKEYPMEIKGYGAGAGVTAAGVFANIMSIANI